MCTGKTVAESKTQAKKRKKQEADAGAGGGDNDEEEAEDDEQDTYATGMHYIDPIIIVYNPNITHSYILFACR